MSSIQKFGKNYIIFRLFLNDTYIIALTQIFLFYISGDGIIVK